MGQREAGILISNTCFSQGGAEGTERQVFLSQVHALLPGRGRGCKETAVLISDTCFSQRGADGTERQVSSSQVHALLPGRG